MSAAPCSAFYGPLSSMAACHGNTYKINCWWALVGNRKPHYRPRLEIGLYRDNLRIKTGSNMKQNHSVCGVHVFLFHKIQRTLLWFLQPKVLRPRLIFRQIHKTNDTRPWINRDGREWAVLTGVRGCEDGWETLGKKL